MDEYQALRLILGIAQLCAVRVLLRRDIGYCFWWGLYMYASAALNIAPAGFADANYKQFVQVPWFAALLLIQFAATLEVFAFLKRRTFPEERSALFGLSVVAGFAPIALRASWGPENWYQAFMLMRQYSVLTLVIGMACAGMWLWRRPVKVEVQVEAHAWMWWVWCFSTSVLSSTTKGGLFWRVFSWEGGGNAWRYASDAMMVLQLALVVLFALNLRRWRTINHHSPRPCVPGCESGGPPLPPSGPYVR